MEDNNHAELIGGILRKQQANNCKVLKIMVDPQGMLPVIMSQWFESALSSGPLYLRLPHPTYVAWIVSIDPSGLT